MVDLIDGLSILLRVLIVVGVTWPVRERGGK